MKRAKNVLSKRGRKKTTELDTPVVLSSTSKKQNISKRELLFCDM